MRENQAVKILQYIGFHSYVEYLKRHITINDMSQEEYYAQEEKKKQ